MFIIYSRSVKMKIKGAVLICVLILLGHYQAEAQDFTKAGRTGFQFVKIGIGARQVAIGEASLAVVRDVNAMYWNPANITGVTRAEASFSYASWFADMSYIAGAAGYRWPGVGVFAVGYSALDFGDIPEALVTAPGGGSDTRTGNMFTGSDMLVGFSFAREFTDQLSIGIGVKYLHESLFDYSTGVFAFDIGSYYDTGFNGIRLAMSAQNFSKSVQWMEDGDRDEGYDIPLIFRVGLAFNIFRADNAFFYMGDGHSLALSIDAIHTNDYAERMHIGAEYWFGDLLAIRGGYRFNYEEGNVSFGFGLRPSISGLHLNLDYAYTHFEFLESPHRFTLSFAF
jgi:hypothetical protein